VELADSIFDRNFPVTGCPINHF